MTTVTRSAGLERARWLFVAIFALGGLNHFRDPAFYLALMPPFLPAHDTLVGVSGITEVATAGLLLASGTVFLGAASALAHLVVFLIIHVFMVLRPDLWPNVPLAALWIRLLVQFVAIALAAWLVRGTWPTSTAR